MILAAPLIAWTATSSGGEETDGLMVERFKGLDGTPELLVSLGEDDANTLETTGGKRYVRFVCLDGEDAVVLDAQQQWPYIDEPGYDYPHAHQQATREQLQRAEECRLVGTNVKLEADVEGALPR